MSWLGDVRFSFRTLIDNPAFTLVAVATLALGIGVNAAVFTVTNAVLFRGFPHVDPENRLLYIGTRSGVSYPDFEDWRAQAKSFRGMAVVANGGLRLILNDSSGVPETCDGTQLSANTFGVIGQQPILGRDFGASDEAPGAGSGHSDLRLLAAAIRDGCGHGRQDHTAERRPYHCDWNYAAGI